jgi:hypothetical protein
MRVTLTVTQGPHAGRAFAFDQHDTFLVGRSAKAHFSLPRHDRYFSRMHFLVEINPPLVCVMDLGSRNGTRVNGARVEFADLRHGDRIRAGRSVIEISIDDGTPEGTPPTPGPLETAEELAARFEEEWRAARGPRVEDFLPEPDDPNRPRVLRELVLLELELRLGTGEPVRVEDYLQRFNELSNDERWLADVVVAESTFRRLREPDLNTDEYSRRFPALWEKIAARLTPGRPRSTRSTAINARTTTADRPQIPGYKLEEKLGSGGMGTVYRAVRLSDGRTVAVKVLTPVVTAEKTAVDRFLREADILRRLQHRHIVSFHALGEADGVLWFAMDLVPGDDAAKLVSREGPMKPDRAVRLMLPVLGALAYAHAEGFVHRDIKPANLLMTEGPAGEEARLADFGLSRAYQASRMSGLTLTGAIAGTPAFMAPEQVLNLREVKPAADQYSAAATLYFLLSGEPPFKREENVHLQILKLLQGDPIPLRNRRPDVWPELERVVHRALESIASDRYTNVAAFAAALSPFAG